MIKKVVIAAAGRGTRMLHLTKNKPKHLININKKPFLAYLLDNILEAGYSDLILVVGYKKEKIAEFIKKYKYNVKIIDQFETLGKKEYGTASSLKCSEKFIGQENFLMVYGDNLYSPKDLKNLNIDDDYNYIAGIVNPNPQKYGILSLENGLLKEIVEKPKTNLGNLINTGLYKFTPEIFTVLPKIKMSPRKEYELTDAINILAQKKKVRVKEIRDYWLDFGNPGDILKIWRFLKNEKK